ncbi:MAG: SurA N-terminal domain-containing protein [Casimicrobiaceae bacterium]
MFDLLHRHKNLAQVIMGLVTLPFVFFGTYQYFTGRGGTDTVAEVGGNRIVQRDFDDALRNQEQRMRQALGNSFDPAMLDNPAVRFDLLDQLINQRLLENRARSEHFSISDAELRRFIAGLAPFQVDGRFSATRYSEVLAGQGMSPLGFEQRVRGELVLGQLQQPIATGSFAAAATVKHYLALLDQTRDVATATIAVAPLEAKIKVSDADIKAYYDRNRAVFETPELAKIEYLTLSQDALAAQMTVTPDEVRQAYESGKRQYATQEERQASHILIAVKPDATAAQKAAAKKRAEEVLAKVRAHPDDFAALTKEYSQDPGSAQQGGDLGSFARGSMVKPFDDAVFGAKVGDIVGPVETNFGYHIIKVTGITPAHAQTLDEVKGRIEAELRKQKAADKFASLAEQFQNVVYEQADSLTEAAKALGLEVKTTGLMTRAQIQALALGNTKFVKAVFSPGSIQAKRNTEAIEVAPNTLMSGRVVEYKPATPKPLAEVQGDIRTRLTGERAAVDAQKDGQAKLVLLAKGDAAAAAVSFGTVVAITRSKPVPDVTPDAMKLIFEADRAKLPAYVGAPRPNGDFAIYRIDNVTDGPPPPAATLTAAVKSVGAESGQELMRAYVASLRADTKVTINQAVLEKKPQE